MTTGEMIKRLRLQKGMSQEKLARKSGVHAISILRYELNRKMPSVDSLRKICKALGKSMGAFNHCQPFQSPRKRLKEGIVRAEDLFGIVTTPKEHGSNLDSLPLP